MRRLGWVAMLASVAAGCALTDPERLRDYNDDGVRLFQRGDYNDARESFQAALALKPGDSTLLYNVGECQDRLGQVDAAEKTYRECLHQSPNHADCIHALDALLVRQQRRPEAGQLVDDWLQRDPRSASAYAEYGWLCACDKDYPKALSACQHAYELDSHDVHVLNELGQLFESLSRTDRALEMYKRSLVYQPDQHEVVLCVSRLKAQGAGRPHPD